MMMSKRNRGRVYNPGCACCDIMMTDMKRYRRMVKRSERQAWKKDI